MYTACPKKAERQIFNTLQAQNVTFLTSLDKTSSAEENGTKIVKFGWVTLNLCTLIEIQSFSNFTGFLRPMSEELCRDEQSIRCSVEAHCSVFLLLPRINGLPQNAIMDGLSRHNSSLIGRKNPAKFETYSISRNGHRIKITQPNLMILVSFSSVEYAWCNDMKKHNTFSSQSTENPTFRFFGTPGIDGLLWDSTNFGQYANLGKFYHLGYT